MELERAVAARRMTRAFDARPIDDEVLDRLLALVARSPSAGFAQGIDLLVLRTEEARSTFWEHATEAGWRAGGTQAAGVMAAPTIVVPVADPGAYVARYGEPDKARSGLAGRRPGDWPVPYWLVDAAFATMTLLLGAADAGLGALFFRLHAPERDVLDAFGVEAGRTTIGAVAIGHRLGPDRSTSPGRHRRRGLDELVHRDCW